ncbi:MAG TPA: DUF2141 domain-containing protein [Marinagarivorans sp.]|nr:DUF2141 domain-containing protein [Cellvibrionaceae bacterium]HMY37857.1 DUF2141 domain-containing protein [Marinagarivorans sp.]HNG58494.1 DUF2141 domain-containing protein [Cellvibrionaceae bacterium]
MRYLGFSNLLISLGFSSLMAVNTKAFELNLIIDHISKSSGNLMIALSNSEASYNDKTAAFRALKIPANQPSQTIHFGDVPPGDYAIKLYQDENDNGQLDTNMLGIPKEGYGFSNNGGAMGQPAFKDAKFPVQENTTITIHLR